jgi:uncharacterized protein YndB with AHSA1/START domain
MPDRGFLIIADITGYTRFLTGSELDHAQGVLEDLFAVILDRLKSPLQLSNIQGDAFFAYARDDMIWSPGQIIDSIEALYFGFRDRLTSIVDNTTCRCRACSNAEKLDLKFIVHHGEYVVQNVADRRELAGSDVILLHRLLKNEVPQQTGIASYALYTGAAVDALDLAEFSEGTQRYVTDIEEFGQIEGAVVDYGARWRAHHMANEIVVADNELWFEPVSRVLPHNVETVWEAYCNPKLKSTWNTIVQGFTRKEGDPGRVTVGAVDHCAHGGQTLIMRYVDVRPLKHVTLEMALPMNGMARWTVQFLPESAGTCVTVRAAKPVGPNAVCTFLLEVIGGLFQKKKVRADFVAQFKLLDGFLADQCEQGTSTGGVAISLSEREIKETAREIMAGECQGK